MPAYGCCSCHLLLLSSPIAGRVQESTEGHCAGPSAMDICQSPTSQQQAHSVRTVQQCLLAPPVLRSFPISSRRASLSNLRLHNACQALHVSPPQLQHEVLTHAVHGRKPCCGLNLQKSLLSPRAHILHEEVCMCTRYARHCTAPSLPLQSAPL